MTDKLKNLAGELARYLIVGLLTTAVSLGTYYGLVLTVLDPQNALQLQLANLISWFSAVTFAYIASRIYVFQSHSSRILKEMFSFYSARVATLLADMLIMFFMVTVMGRNDKIAKLIVQVVVTAGNYILSKVFVFRK